MCVGSSERGRGHLAEDIARLISIRRGMSLVRCRDVEEVTLNLRAMLKNKGLSPAICGSLPLDAGEFLEFWCGVGTPPDPLIAESLVKAAQLHMHIASAGASLLERHWELESAQDESSNSAGQVATILLGFGVQEPAMAVRRTLNQLQAMGLSSAEQFQKFAQLMGTSARPILFDGGQLDDGRASMLHGIAHTVEMTPEAQLIVVIDPSSWNRLQQLSDLHVVALFREGLIDWPEGSSFSDAATPKQPESREEKMGAGNFATMDQTVSLEDLKARACRAVDAALRFANAPESAHTPVEYSEARSLAEALLFAALAADRRTTGLFNLNADGGFIFGSQPAEIDLFCQSLGIAIEVDGYFHFQDKQCYRRDRTKDWLMQRHGYVVLRFLAEDVAERVSGIVDLIATAVEVRRGTRRSEDSIHAVKH